MIIYSASRNWLGRALAGIRFNSFLVIKTCVVLLQFLVIHSKCLSGEYILSNLQKLLLHLLASLLIDKKFLNTFTCLNLFTLNPRFLVPARFLSFLLYGILWRLFWRFLDLLLLSFAYPVEYLDEVVIWWVVLIPSFFVRQSSLCQKMVFNWSLFPKLKFWVP